MVPGSCQETSVSGQQCESCQQLFQYVDSRRCTHSHCEVALTCSFRSTFSVCRSVHLLSAPFSFSMKAAWFCVRLSFCASALRLSLVRVFSRLRRSVCKPTISHTCLHQYIFDGANWVWHNVALTWRKPSSSKLHSTHRIFAALQLLYF